MNFLQRLRDVLKGQDEYAVRRSNVDARLDKLEAEASDAVNLAKTALDERKRIRTGRLGSYGRVSVRH